MRKNIRKISSNLELQVREIADNEIAVYCTRELLREDVEAGKCEELGIVISNGKLEYHEFIPLEEKGKYSNWNINGREIKRKDLPMKEYQLVFDAPDWNGNGTHTVTMTKEKYQVDLIAPRYSTIEPELLKEADGKYLFMFTLSEVLDKSADEFYNRLLYCINIMQENFRKFNIRKSKLSREEYLATNHIEWEILPVGTKEDFIERLFTGRKHTDKQKEEAIERFDFIKTMNPMSLVYGTDGMYRYYGAKLENDIVIFENNNYGNAMYIMYDNWGELSKKSRIQLLSGTYGTNFDRVIHSENWQRRARIYIEKARNNQRIV